MYGSILPVTIHPPGIPLGVCDFFVLGCLFPAPGHEERDNSPPPELLVDTSNTLFCVQNIDNNIDFHTFDKNSSAFLEFIERWMLHVYNKNINTIFEKEKSNRTSLKERSLRPADRTVLLQNSQKRESTNRLFYQIITL